MTSSIFRDWLERFQSYVQTKPGRNVILLIDNCSAHGNQESLPVLPNVKIIFLPPNCTSKVQPCDAGIIAALKLRYKSMHMERALENSDVNVKNIYKVDVLTAMRWFKRAWLELPAAVIHNCWRHTGLIGGEDGNIEGEFQHESALMTELAKAVDDLVPSRVRMSIADLLHPEGEDDVLQEPSDDALVDSILETSNMAGHNRDAAEDSDDEEGEQGDPLPSSQEQLRVLLLAKRIVEAHGEDTQAFRSCVRRTQWAVRAESRAAARQSTIDRFFK